jgi:hypothetical protein
MFLFKIPSIIANNVSLTVADFNLDSTKATWFDKVERLVKDQITEITEVNLAGQGGVVLGQLDADGIAKREAFIGSSSDDRVVANGGADIFSNFQGADTFLGGADGVVLVYQTNYLHSNESDTPYLHIELITGKDLKNTLDPQMAGSVNTNLLGLRIVDDVVNQPTYVGDVAETIWKLIQRNAKGIYHVAGCEEMSLYKFVGFMMCVKGFHP